MDALTRAAHAARSGDREALEWFVTQTYPDVWRLCAALVHETVADDLAQETFARATRALRRFRGQAEARTWVLAIARRVCMDELRGRYRQRRRDQHLALIAERDAAAGDPAASIELHELLAQLEPDRRAAFVLTQLLRLTYDEAAVVCDCPTGTIRSRVARARDQLVGLLDREPARHRAPQR